mmetsp:Transcript_21575/g.41198  ORF Transcript_21575/g.41198 Transcript_21575/m.41198 type:complete len:83 (-) Transcript_21575:429-677(-)
MRMLPALWQVMLHGGCERCRRIGTEADTDFAGTFSTFRAEFFDKSGAEGFDATLQAGEACVRVRAASGVLVGGTGPCMPPGL